MSQNPLKTDVTINVDDYAPHPRRPQPTSELEGMSNPEQFWPHFPFLPVINLKTHEGGTLVAHTNRIYSVNVWLLPRCKGHHEALQWMEANGIVYKQFESVEAITKEWRAD